MKTGTGCCAGGCREISMDMSPGGSSQGILSVPFYSAVKYVKEGLDVENG